MFGFTLKTLIRRWFTCLLLIVLICGGTFGMTFIGGLKQNQEVALEKLYNDTQILCTVSNLRGTLTDGLRIIESYIDLCTKETETQDFSKWIEHLMLKRSITGKNAVGEECTLTGFTYVDGVRELREENSAAITFFEDYTETIFQSEEFVCIVPAVMLSDLLQEDGTYHYFTMTVPTWIEGEDGLVEGEESISLKVVGSYTGTSSAVYCPFFAMPQMFEFFDYYAESISFYVKDNRQLEEFKVDAMQYFSEPKITKTDFTGKYGITIYDDLFCESEQGVKDNLMMLHIIIPVLYVLSAGIGFLASFLFIKGRTKEFAIMRSMGVYRRQVIGLIFSEQILFTIIGGMIGCILYIRIFEESIYQLIGGGLFLVCYLVGALSAITWITNVNVMLLLKNEE